MYDGGSKACIGYFIGYLCQAKYISRTIYKKNLAKQHDYE